MQSQTSPTFCVLLAGGQGSRLHELTAMDCKPAVPKTPKPLEVVFLKFMQALNTERPSSHVEDDRGLVREFLFLNAKDWTMDLVINPRQVGSCRSLTDATEFVVD